MMQLIVLGVVVIAAIWIFLYLLPKWFKTEKNEENAAVKEPEVPEEEKPFKNKSKTKKA